MSHSRKCFANLENFVFGKTSKYRFNWKIHLNKSLYYFSYKKKSCYSIHKITRLIFLNSIYYTFKRRDDNFYISLIPHITTHNTEEKLTNTEKEKRMETWVEGRQTDLDSLLV